MRILVVGDVHGNVAWVHNVVIPRAQAVGASKIVQVGDFGFVWPGLPHYSTRLDKLSGALEEAGIDLHFLPGNHEDFDQLELLTDRAEGFSPEGHVRLRPRLFYTGKVASWEWSGVRCAAVGGATSIDRQWRVIGESWWPQEALTEAEAARARALAPVEVLFAHDAPTQHPFALKLDPDSQAHRQRITDVARALRPGVWFHGHYHQFAEYSFRHADGHAQVIGLDYDGSTWARNTAVLDLAEGSTEVFLGLAVEGLEV